MASFEIQNYPLENFWQFAHYHPKLACIFFFGLIITLGLFFNSERIKQFFKELWKRLTKVGPVEMSAILNGNGIESNSGTKNETKREAMPDGRKRKIN